jgi:hypothetical protein
VTVRGARGDLREQIGIARDVATRRGCASDLVASRKQLRAIAAARRGQVRRADLATPAAWLAGEFAPAAQLTAAA